MATKTIKLDLFHGSGADFDKFDLSKYLTGADAGSQSWYGKGIYLSGEGWKGASYAYAAGDGFVYRVTAEIAKPFIVRGTSASDLTSALKEIGVDSSLRGESLTKALQSAGFDSVVVYATDSEIVNELVSFRDDNLSIIEKIKVREFDVQKYEKVTLPKSKLDALTQDTVPSVVKTANEEMLDALMRHQIYILRYSGHVRNQIISILNASEEELARRIRDKLRTMQGLTKPVEWQRLETLQATLKAIRMESWDEATKFLQNEMVQLSYREPIQLDGILKTVLPVTVDTVMPSANMLKAIALSRPFEGRILKEWADTMAADDIRRIHGAIQAGMVAGEDMATIARRVVGTGPLKGADGVTEITRRQVQAITRTAVQHVANDARDAYFAENADIIAAEQFVATLDSRTTPICRSMDGKVFPLGKGPRPPLHFNCRSLRIAAIDGTLAGDRPAKPATQKMLVREYAEKNGLGSIRSRDQLPRGTKGDFDKWSRGRIRELVGPIPASTNYQEWLKGQTKAFQDEVLGVTKAKLFRDGGLTLDKFVHRSGDELTLRELAQKHADAFRAAGLDPSKY